MTKHNWFTTTLPWRTAEHLNDFNPIIAPYEFTPGSFYENCDRLALELADKHDKLYLCYSGGIDSEFVLKVFNDLKLPITPLIMSTPFNTRESEYAFKFCENNSIKPEVVEYSKNDIIDQLNAKTCSKGLFSLLGGLPMIACDMVNQVGGKLLTGYGEPFTTLPGIQPMHRISTNLEFCEWDYYLDAYDSSHPSGFFTYDLAVMHSLISEISYDIPTQIAKYNIYRVEPRIKMFWDTEFYQVFRELKNPNIKKYDHFIEKQVLLDSLKDYIRK
jgi:hypothetical protein